MLLAEPRFLPGLRHMWGDVMATPITGTPAEILATLTATYSELPDASDLDPVGTDTLVQAHAQAIPLLVAVVAAQQQIIDQLSAG